MSRMVRASSVDIIMQSKEYTSKMDEIMRSLYIGAYVIVKHQDAENSRDTVDRTGEISYIHSNKTYFNVKFDDTGVEESYYPSDVLKGIVRMEIWMAKEVTITKEGMIRTGEYVNKLRKAQQDGIVDNIPTATDILVELIKNAKATTEGIVSVYGITFIEGQDYELYEVKPNKNIKNNVGNKIW